MRRAVLFLAAWTVAASGLAACRRGTLGEPDAGGGTLTGVGGAAPASGVGGATAASGVGGAVPAGGAGGAAGAGAAGGARAPAPLCAGGASYSYLVRWLVALEYSDADAVTYGFDLDGRVSDGTAPEDCRVADRTSPDGRAGIDNTVAGFWTEDLRTVFDRSYAEGSAPIVIRLTGVDSLESDDCVDLEWFGARAFGERLNPGNPEASGRQLQAAGPIARLPGARIEAGRLLANGSAPIELRGAFVLPLVLSRIAFATGVEELTEGQLGGRVQPEDVHRVYQSLAGGAISRELIDSILFPDLPSAQSPCALLSAGFGFRAVRVMIVP